jgi:ABC-type multidrug transport system ATPase subunit
MKLKAKFLSGGNKRKLLIAISLISMPKLLLLDEATSGLDMITRRKLLQYIKKLSITRNMTVVMTT